jgi:PAS domain S-box-containing protein
MISCRGMSADGHIRELVERTPVVTFVKDGDGRYLYVNEAWTAFFGLTSEQILGHRDDEIFPGELSAVYMQNDRRVLDAGEAIEIEEKAIVNGTERTFLSTKFPVHYQGQRVVGGISIDITDRVTARLALVRSEARYRELVEHSPIAYVVLDPTTGRYVEANANAQRLFELSEEEILRVGPA